MIIYMDVVLVENFLINFFLLLITLQVINQKISYKRIAFSSTIGITYVFFVLVSNINFLAYLPFKLLVAFIMIFFTQKERKILSLIKTLIIFIIISFTFCGICFMFALNQNKYNLLEDFNIKNYSIKYLIFAGMIIYITMNRIIFYLKDRFILNNFLYNIEIKIKDNKIKVKAFLDTGNELVEPVTLLPVIILEQSSMPNINISKDEIFNIPYGLVNGQSGYMIGVKADEVKLYKSNTSEAMSKQAIICFCNRKLNINGEYKALLSRGII